MNEIVFTLYSRSYCHLCDDMLDQLQSLTASWLPGPSCRIDIVDVDADDEALALYDELVPVLTARRGIGAPARLCHYFLDESAVLGWLAASAG